MSAFSPAIREFLAAPDDTRRLGPYRCLTPLDKAGFAPVFRAVEEHAGHSLREVAVKVFDIGRAPDPKGKDAKDAPQPRVVDEARSLCRVQHPNVIRFHTLCTDRERGLMGLVMEFAQGVSLERQLEDIPAGDARRVALAVEVGICVSGALAAAHEAGIVHCNVKPSNIMFTDGTYKLINFGIAASERAEKKEKEESRALVELDDLPPESIGMKASTLDKGGSASTVPLAGTVGYVDPVCLRTTSPPNAASDLYALGATLYQCLAGSVPAVATAKKSGKSGVDAKVLVGDSPAAALADVAPSTPAALAKLVDALVSPSQKGRPRSAEAVTRTLGRIRSELAGHARALPPEDRGPFRGLERFEAADRDVFFGRSAEIAGVIELCRTRGLVGVVGLSGTGKSSLVRAGVLPSIEEGALGGWPKTYRHVVITPGADPMKTLAAALSDVLGAPAAEHPEAIVQQLAADVDQTGRGLVIVIDQLEEIVTLHDKSRDKGRLAVLDLLSRLAEGPAGLRVIVTVRRDLLDEILAIDPHFSRALSRGMHMLGPLSGTGWEEVLDRALEAYGYGFEGADLRGELLKDVRGLESAMPLVSFALTRLWAARDKKDKKITRAGLGAKGGIRGALEQHADACVAKLDIEKDTLRDLCLAMTTPQGTRAQVPRATLVDRFGKPAKGALAALTKARLVSEETAGVSFVHDSLLSEWKMLRGWLDDARDDRLLKEHLERDAARWSDRRDVAELWRKSRLGAALDLKRRGGVRLSDDAQAFLDASLAEERKAQAFFWSTIVLVVALIVGGALWNAKQSADRATQARKDADALAAALAEVKILKHQTEEAALEAAASAALLHALQKKIEAERATFGANVQAALKKVDSVDSARAAAADLKAQGVTAQNNVVPLPDLGGQTSPRPTDPQGPGPSAGPGTFDQGAIERVVNTRKAGVKRICLDKGSSTASTTKVTATLTIAPSGAVQDVSSSGDDPVVAKCIENQLHSWSFPAPGEVKQVQIPFVFVRQ